MSKTTRNCRNCGLNLPLEKLATSKENGRFRYRCIEDCESKYRRLKRQSESLQEMTDISQEFDAPDEPLQELSSIATELDELNLDDLEITEEQQFNSETASQLEIAKAEIQKLQKLKTQLIRELADEKQAVQKLTITEQPKIVDLTSPLQPKAQETTAILQLSDLHIGAEIDGNYVKGRGFNEAIATESFKKILSGVKTFIKERRLSVPVNELIISLNGDLVEVLDHGQGQIELTDQVLLCQDLLYSLLLELKDIAPRTRVVVTSGNHDRLSHFKRTPTDTRTRRSYTWLIAQNLKRQLPELDWYIEEAYVAEFQVYKWNILQHHGDRIKGGSGVGGIAPALMRYHYKLATIQPFDFALMGHFHTSQMFDGRILVNGCLCGDTPYTRELGLKSDRCQNLIFIDSVYGLNAFHRIYA